MPRPNTSGVCPHCGKTVVFTVANASNPEGTYLLGPDENLHCFIEAAACPGCHHITADLVWRPITRPPFILPPKKQQRVCPLAGTRRVPAPEVNEAVKSLYQEAALVETFSARAAAALARACLEAALTDCGFQGKRLIDQIDAAKQDRRTPSTLIEKLDIVRTVGNYAAHPTPSTSGEFLQVETEEPYALFGALEEFFDIYYVKPERHKAQKAAINAKLQSADKKPIP